MAKKAVTRQRELKIIVVSKADVNRIFTLRLLEEANYDYTVVVHDHKAQRRLEEVGIPSEKIVRSGTKTLVDKRNWILRKLVEPGEWFIGMDDNIRGWTLVQEPFFWHDQNPTDKKPPRGFKSWREVYNDPVDTKTWLTRFMNGPVRDAMEKGIPLVGVATMENPYFRARRKSNYRFVKTKVFAMQNTGKLHFRGKMGHDSYLSALCVAEHGKVLVDSFFHYKVKMYEGGGLGTSREERDANGLAESLDHSVKKFEGLVVKAKGKNSALKFRLTNENSVEAWRREHGYPT